MDWSCPGVVSIQRIAAGDAVDRHLSWALLVTNDLVVAPAPLDWLRDPKVDFEVLVASARHKGPGVVERIRVRRADIVGLDGAPSGAAAILQLEHRSRHRPHTAEFVRDEFEAVLAEEADVWQALATVGAVPRDLLDQEVLPVLGPVASWERARRANSVHERLSSPPELAATWCCLDKCCAACVGRWW
jgi:hypothetical protein